MVVDKILTRELQLYIENDGRLYERRAKPIMDMLAKRKAKGTYDSKLAVKGMLPLVVDGINAYRRDFGLGMVSGEDKLAIAKLLLSGYLEEINAKAKSFKKVLAKKKKPNKKVATKRKK